MIQKLSVPVSVILAFNHQTRTVLPRKILFEGRERVVKSVGFHHTYRDGRVLYHVFSVVCETLFFRLALDTETLFWRLEEVADGESD